MRRGLHHHPMHHHHMYRRPLYRPFIRPYWRPLRPMFGPLWVGMMLWWIVLPFIFVFGLLVLRLLVGGL